MSKKLEQNIKDILETVTFIKDNAVFKDEFSVIKDDLAFVKDDLAIVKANMATKDDIRMVNERIDELPTREDYSVLQTAVDNYAKKVETYFVETISLRAQFNRLQGSLAK